MTERQCTLKTSAGMRGRGLHTGEECGLTILPAAPDVGIVFATRQGEIRASVENVRDTLRGTTLGSGKAEVHTVEHLLAALAGMSVDNARIEIDGPEIPAGDGSALPFVELIESAGIVEQEADARIRVLTEPEWALDGGKCAFAAPHDGFRANVLISFQHPLIGEQALSVNINPETFKREIAPARTFCTSDEIEAILSQGLGKGGSEDNVIVVHEYHYSVPLRLADEFVRHKALDLIGDLALVSGRLHANVTAVRTSHSLNVALADKIARRLAEKRQGG